MLLQFSLAGLVLTTLLSGVCQGQTQVTCQSRFLTQFLQCVSDSGQAGQAALNPQHFLWLTREENMGSKPPDLPGFTKQACMVETKLGACFKTLVEQYENGTATAPAPSAPGQLANTVPVQCSDTDKQAIRSFYRKVMLNFDSKCAHPCRGELVKSLAQCFTSAEVNAEIFLSNVTMSRDTMLGNGSQQADVFCRKRDEIFECMRTKTEVCPETPEILMSAGIDVDAMNNTISLLCDNRQLYLHGARCLANSSDAETQCQYQLVTSLSTLETQYKTFNIEHDVYQRQVCTLRLDHIRCDLNAISRRGSDSRCNTLVVGLRREQECALIPAGCARQEAQRVMDMCDPMRFLRDQRGAFVAAQRSHAPSAHTGSGVFLFAFASLSMLSRQITSISA